jgi:hypothetical protein
MIRDYRYAYTDYYGEENPSLVEDLERTYEVFDEWQQNNADKVKQPD